MCHEHDRLFETDLKQRERFVHARDCKSIDLVHRIQNRSDLSESDAIRVVLDDGEKPTVATTMKLLHVVADGISDDLDPGIETVVVGPNAGDSSGFARRRWSPTEVPARPWTIETLIGSSLLLHTCKSEPLQVQNDDESRHTFVAKRPILAGLNCGINDG